MNARGIFPYYESDGIKERGMEIDIRHFATRLEVAFRRKMKKKNYRNVFKWDKPLRTF